MSRLRDVNGTVWYVRNGEVLRVGNRSQGYAQVIVDLPVPYDADLCAVGAAMKAAADELAAEPAWAAAVLEEPELLGVEQIGEERVVLRLTVKVRPADQWQLARELRRRIADRLHADGTPARAHRGARGAHPAGPGRVRGRRRRRAAARRPASSRRRRPGCRPRPADETDGMSRAEPYVDERTRRGRPPASCSSSEDMRGQPHQRAQIHRVRPSSCIDSRLPAP